MPWMLLAAWAYTTSRRLFQIGIIAAGVGAGLVGIAGLGLLPRLAPAPPAPDGTAAPARSHASFVGPTLIIAGILMVAGFILMILTVHYGVSPFSPRKSR